MLKALRENPRALLLSITFHLAVVTVLVVSLQWRPSLPTSASSAQPVIQAVAVDQMRVEKEVQRLQAAEAKKRAAEQQRQQAARQALEQAKRKRQAEEQRLARLKKQQAAEEAKRREAEKQQRLAAQKAEQARLAAQKAAQARKAAQQAEQQRLEQLRKQREAEQQRLAALEAKRKMEEQKRREAEEKHRREEEDKRRRAEEQQALQAQIAAEQKRLEAERQRIGQQTVAKYTDLIRQKVGRSWLLPPGSQNTLHCTVQVRLIPSGDVVDVQVVATSGDPVFDRSVETAVRKASPLPLPPDPGLFEQMRTIRFVFDPSKG